MKYLLLLIVLVGLVAAAVSDTARQRVDLEIPVECIKHAAMIDCDLNFEPPKCRSSAIEYRPASCPLVHIVKEK